MMPLELSGPKKEHVCIVSSVTWNMQTDKESKTERELERERGKGRGFWAALCFGCGGGMRVSN